MSRATYRMSTRRLLMVLPMGLQGAYMDGILPWSLYTLVFNIYRAGRTTCARYTFTSENGCGTSD